MKKMIIILILLFSLHLNSAPISKNEAYKIGEYFLNKIDKSLEKILVREVSMPYWLDISDEFYVFESNNAYVVVAGDDAVVPILAYSDEINFSIADSMPPSLSLLLSQYKEQIKIIRQKKLSATVEIKAQWQELVNKEYKSRSQVGPLLHCTWDQGCKYNALCPIDPAGPCGRVYAGCVATAMAMNMFYYRHPTNPTGNAFHYTNYGLLHVNLNQHTYNYEKMPTVVTDSSYEVAKLIYHCGITVKMGYSPYGSGASMSTAGEQMKIKFGYNPNLSLKQRNDYTDDEWCNMLRSQLDQQIILQYAAYDENSGHAFVCDGYSDNDYFHFNWGWGGYYNGFYYINNLNPGYDFFYGHQAIFDCYPTSPAYTCSHHTLISHSGSLTSSSPHLSQYENNANCTWLIDIPDTLKNITLEVRYFSTLPGDTLYIYKGIDDSGELIAKWSGDNVPTTLVINHNPIFIKFITNSSGTDKGFLIDYFGFPASFCSIFTTYNSPDEIILSDGSGSYNYRPNVYCRWFLYNYNNYEYDFIPVMFDLATGDTLKIYEDFNSGNVLSYSFNKNNPAHSFTSSASRVIFTFITDDYDEGDGFEFFINKKTSISDHFNNDNFQYSIIDDLLYIWIESDLDNDLVLYSLTGQELYHIQSPANLNSPIIVPFNYNEGIYYLKQQNKNKIYLHKIIKL